MDIETAANPAGGEDTSAQAGPEAVTPEATAAPAEGASTEIGSENTDALALASEEDEFEEIERGEKKYRIPKALKGELLMHQDYTRKTMEVAEQRKALEAAKAEVERAQALTTEERRAYGKLEALHEQVAAYEKVDWDTLEATDPAEAQRHWRLYQTAKDQRQQVYAALQQHEAKKTQEAQQTAAKRRAEVEAQVAKEIPNWPARRPELEAFAAKHGYAPEALAENADVNDFKLLHYAYEGFKFIERQRAAAKAAAAGAVKPAPEVGGTAAAGLDPNKMTMEQFIAARESGQL